MPHSKIKAAELSEDLKALSRGHEAIYDSVDHGNHMSRALKMKRDFVERNGVWQKNTCLIPGISMWALMFLTRKPMEEL